MSTQNAPGGVPVDRPPQPWTGRKDGEGAEHLRWHQAIRPLTAEHPAERQSPGAAVLGFASDEGVERNQGRRGAAEGPDALRAALAGLPLLRRDADLHLYDAGTVTTEDPDLEGGQRALGAAVTALLDAGHLPVILGGGHEVAYGTYLGLAGSALAGRTGRAPEAGSSEAHPSETTEPPVIGILNLDAHFDLRPDARPSSGTPFRQILEQEAQAGTRVRYGVVGISEASNTQALFDAADAHGVQYLLDEQCTAAQLDSVLAFVERFLEGVDLLYLTLDLDALPAAVAPGVSAPAAYGVPLEVLERVAEQAAATGRLAVFDVAEMNPRYDADGRTAKTAARLIHRVVTTHHRHRNTTAEEVPTA